MERSQLGLPILLTHMHRHSHQSTAFLRYTRHRDQMRRLVLRVCQRVHNGWHLLAGQPALHSLATFVTGRMYHSSSGIAGSKSRQKPSASPSQPPSSYPLKDRATSTTGTRANTKTTDTPNKASTLPTAARQANSQEVSVRLGL